MSTIERSNDAGLADFLAGWDASLREEPITIIFGVIGLTNFGERPVPSTRLAEVLGRPVSEAEELARQWSVPWTRVENGLIDINPERNRLPARRHLQIGDRRFGMTGCGPDIFGYAPLVRPSLHLEETCTATGTPIRILFTATDVEHVEPASTVLAIPTKQDVEEMQAGLSESGHTEEGDAKVCSTTPLFSSAEAAEGWLADHRGGRLFTIREAWDLSFLRDYRDRMSALLNLDG